MGKIYGYVRVSSVDQNEDRQLICMSENKVPEGNVYIDKQSGNPTYESVKNVLSEVADTFTVYDISAVLNGAEVQPNGEVTVTFNIPDGYGTGVAVFYISDEGTYEKLESIVSEDGKTVSAKLNHFSSYAVCKLGVSDSANTGVASEPTEQPTESNNTILIVIAIVAVLLIAGAVIAVIIIKKRKLSI